MTGETQTIRDVWFLTTQGLDTLIQALQARGYAVIAPRVLDGVIAFGEVTSVDQIASGVRDELGPGRVPPLR